MNYIGNSWTCSDNFTDPTYAKTFCPYIKDECGDTRLFNLTSKGDNQTLNITNLEVGVTCYYQLQA